MSAAAVSAGHVAAVSAGHVSREKMVLGEAALSRRRMEVISSVSPHRWIMMEVEKLARSRSPPAASHYLAWHVAR